MLTRRGIAALGATAALVLTGITAGTASASTSAHPLTSKVTITTQSDAHQDTTYGSDAGPATLPSGNGPVWAVDNLNERWTITPVSGFADGANYQVTMTTTKGTRFAEFADPGASNNGVNGETDPCAALASTQPGDPHTGTGTLHGTITYDVNSSAAPDLTSVPAVQQPGVGLGTVLGQIFDQGSYSVVGNTPYDFTYSKVCGATYEQNSAHGG